MSISEELRKNGVIVPKEVSKDYLRYLLDLGARPIVKFVFKKLFSPYTTKVVILVNSSDNENFPSDLIDIQKPSINDIKCIIDKYDFGLPIYFLNRKYLFSNYKQ